MAPRNTTPSWLDSVAGLLVGHNQRPHRMVRRLHGERLENRTVLSVAPLPVEPQHSESLVEYLDRNHQMGPTAPSGLAAPVDQAAHNLAVLGPATVDHFFGIEHGEGEGDGSSSGSGSGGGSAVGSGSGASSGSGSGSGSSSGSGSGSGSGSSS